MAKIDANDAPKTDPKPDVKPDAKPDVKSDPDSKKASESYLGTWQDKAAAEEGLGNMKKVMDSQGTEVGALRKQVKMMEQSMDSIQKQSETAKPDEPKGPDYGKELKAVQKEKASLDMDELDYQAKASVLDARMLELVEASTTEKVLGMAQVEFAKLLDERDVQSTHKDFYRDHPDFNTPEMQTAIQDRVSNDMSGMSDPLSAYWEIKAEASTTELDEAKTQIEDYERRLNLKAGEEETGTVITKGQSPQQKTKQPKATGADRDKGMQDALNALRT